MKKCGWVGFLAAALLAAGVPPVVDAQGTETRSGPRADAEVVDRVAAVVGNHPLLRSEIEEHFEVLARQFQVDQRDTARANQLRREILDNLINEQLLTQQAEALGLKVDQAQIDKAVEETIENDRDRLGEDGFQEQLKTEGLTEPELRSIYAGDIRGDFLRRQLIHREVFSKIEITDAQVERHFRENRERIGNRPRALRVLDIYIRVRPDSMVEQSHRARAFEIREEISKGLSFEDAVRRYSDDERSRARGGMLGRFGPGDLGDRSFEAVAFTLPVGQVSDPLRTNLGYHIIQVMSRDPNNAWTQVRHILVGVAATRSDEQRSRQRAERIREMIVSGKIDFATAVERYSDDEASRSSGGDVGWLPIDNFLGETRAAVEELRVGTVSDVAGVEGGFHIFKLIGEQAETNYSLDEVRDDLREMVEMEERKKALDSYLAELRKKTFVEVRPIR